MMTSENRISQVVEAGFTVLASIALPVRLGIIPAMTGHGSTAADRTPSGQRCWRTRSKHLASSISDDRFTKGPSVMGTIERDRQSPSQLISALIVTASPAPSATTPESGKSLTSK
jgi:hypothetical protein